MHRDPEEDLSQLPYLALLQGKGPGILPELAKKAIKTRIDFESQMKQNKKFNYFDFISDNIQWKNAFTKKNIAVVSFKLKGSSGDPILSKAGISNLDKKPDMKPGEWTAQRELDGHGERIALVDAINQARSQGWQPKDEKGSLIPPFSEEFPPSQENLLKYKPALKEAEIVVYTEIKPCKDKLGGLMSCGELLDTLLSDKDHNLYYSYVDSVDKNQVKAAEKYFAETFLKPSKSSEETVSESATMVNFGKDISTLSATLSELKEEEELANLESHYTTQFGSLVEHTPPEIVPEVQKPKEENKKVEGPQQKKPKFKQDS